MTTSSSRRRTYTVLFFLLSASHRTFGFSSISKPQAIAPPKEEPHHFEFPEAELLKEHNAVSLDLWQLALAGSLATLLSDSVMHPVDCIKTFLQSDEGMMVGNQGILGGVAFLWQTYGVGGFYRGLGAYAASDALGGALKFATFESLQRYVQPRITSKTQQHISSFLCAAVAFVVSSSLIVPGELMKQQLQMGMHSSLSEAASSVYQAHGVKGFFTGYDGVCLRDIPYTMIELGLYDLLKKTTEAMHQDENDTSWFSQLEPWQRDIASAAVTGGVAAFVTTPLDTIKTKVMVNSYSNFYDCLVSTVHNHGALSVFAGADARVAWLVPFTAIYLPIYDYIKRQMQKAKVQQ